MLTRPYGDLVSNVESRWEPEAVLERAAGHFDAGELRVEVGATFLLEQAAEAHRALEAGQIIGKVVLTME